MVGTPHPLLMLSEPPNNPGGITGSYKLAHLLLSDNKEVKPHLETVLRFPMHSIVNYNPKGALTFL